MTLNKNNKPLILAPAGSHSSFLAALAAGADVIYCSFKKFSARMKAKNFDFNELIKLANLAKKNKIGVYIAINGLIKPHEIKEVKSILSTMKKCIEPNALIIQDLGLIPLIKDINFKGEIHLSTLANVSFPEATKFISEKLKIYHSVLPRELNIDEIKLISNQTPKNYYLESFVHGALCYAVSGRCYWSSYMGGKSSLRGQCVQPCRRQYKQNEISERSFSCCDLSLDILVKLLNNINNIKSWKIEGRKKGPHYVYQTVTAYKMLRDFGEIRQTKKKALNLLENCLGRYGTHYNFLPQRPQNPIKIKLNTGSGLLLGKIKGGKKPFFISKVELLPGDVLRIGYEDEPWHCINYIKRAIPKKGKFFIKIKKNHPPRRETPIFLKDRITKELSEKMSKIDDVFWNNKNKEPLEDKTRHLSIKNHSIKQRTLNIKVSRSIKDSIKMKPNGIWLSKLSLKNFKKLETKYLWVWLPPIMWPSSESNLKNLIRDAYNKGARNFVLNIPWQMSFFKEYKLTNIWAGPFCNISNPISLKVFKNMGYKGAIISPELHINDYIELANKRSIPIGIVISGNWPLCISRIKPTNIKTNSLFTSPKNEGGWISKIESEYWVFPNWKLNIAEYRNKLIKAGYSMFISINEDIPNKIILKSRPGLWNSKIGLK